MGWPCPRIRSVLKLPPTSQIQMHRGPWDWLLIARELFCPFFASHALVATVRRGLRAVFTGEPPSGYGRGGRGGGHHGFFESRQLCFKVWWNPLARGIPSPSAPATIPVPNSKLKSVLAVQTGVSVQWVLPQPSFPIVLAFCFAWSPSLAPWPLSMICQGNPQMPSIGKAKRWND